ncbi:hypothetical protein ABGB12_17665 [Actinocorallia sp. B10E7]|uniref:hypothetical protein n=1 Tax=Actinocorallia sp. B10E7 TaxID=3153558 RepID=UPI00325F92AE
MTRSRAERDLPHSAENDGDPGETPDGQDGAQHDATLGEEAGAGSRRLGGQEVQQNDTRPARLEVFRGFARGLGLAARSR